MAKPQTPNPPLGTPHPQVCQLTPVNSLCANIRSPVLLQTAVADVVNPERPEQKLSVRLIFDGGSQ